MLESRQANFVLAPPGSQVAVSVAGGARMSTLSSILRHFEINSATLLLYHIIIIDNSFGLLENTVRRCSATSILMRKICYFLLFVVAVVLLCDKLTCVGAQLVEALEEYGYLYVWSQP